MAFPAYADDENPILTAVLARRGWRLVRLADDAGLAYELARGGRVYLLSMWDCFGALPDDLAAPASLHVYAADGASMEGGCFATVERAAEWVAAQGVS